MKLFQSGIDKALSNTHVRQFAGLLIIPDSGVHRFIPDLIRREGEIAYSCCKLLLAEANRWASLEESHMAFLLLLLLNSAH